MRKRGVKSAPRVAGADVAEHAVAGADATAMRPREADDGVLEKAGVGYGENQIESIKDLTIDSTCGKLRKSHVCRKVKMPNQNLSEEQTYEVFMQQVLREKGLAENSKEAQQLQAQLDEIVQRAVIESLTDEQLERLDQMLDQEASDEEIEAFFAEANINYDEAANLALERFRKELSGGVADTTTMTNDSNINNMAQPMQGTSSEVSGASDVEGVALSVSEEE